MDEARWYLRFIMPGVVYSVLSLAMITLLVPALALPALEELSRALGVGAIVGALAGSGALGYVFSAVHHQLTWSLPRWSVIDHQDLAQRLLRGQVLVVNRLATDATGIALNPERVDRETAQTLLLSFWYQRMAQEPIRSGDVKVQALTDTAHAAGIAAVAALFAFVTAFVTAAWVGQWSFEAAAILRFIIASAIGIGSTVLFARAYLRVSRMARRVIENVLLDAIERSAPPLRLTVS